MTYTATDEDGDEASFNFTITVQRALRTAKQNLLPTPRNLSVTRKQFSGTSAPALNVSWDAPVHDQTNLGYSLRYGAKGKGWVTPYLGFDSSTTSTTLSNLTAGTEYQVQVRVKYAVDGFSEWSYFNVTTNSPPQTTTGYYYVKDHVVGVTYRGQNPLSGFFTDPDGDTLTYSTSAEHPGVANYTVTTETCPKCTGTGERIEIKLLNPATTKLTYGAYDGYGGYVSRWYTVTGTQDVTRSVTENSAAGTLVGDPVTGTQHGSVALTYTLTGDASRAFEIHRLTGQIKLKQGAPLDYEKKDSYTGQVKWTVQSQQAVANLTINIVDVTPGKPSAPTVTRKAFSRQTTHPALDVTWTAPDANGTTIHRYKAQYRVKAAEGEDDAEWTAYSGALDANARTLSLSGLLYGTTYEVQVRAVDDHEGAGPWSDAGVGTTNRQPNPTALSIPATTIPWGETKEFDLAADGANYFEDADGDTLTYWAESPYPGIIGVSVEGSVLSITALNPGSYSILYGALDPYGGQTSRLVQKITASGDVTREVPENAAAGTNVGAPITATPYNDDYISYGFDGEAADSGKFVIDYETGQISVKEGATLDHETKSSYTGRVHWVMYGDQYPAATVTIKVTDVGAGKPGTPTLTRTTFSEPSNPALDVTWTAATANGGATVIGHQAQFRKKAAQGEDPADWTAYTGALSATATSLNLVDLEAGATYEVQVRGVSTEDGAGPWSDTGEGTANRPPTATSAPFNDGTFPVGSVADYRETGQGALGVLFQDADGDTLTYAASAQHPALLGVSLSGDPGEAHLKATLLNPGASKINLCGERPLRRVRNPHRYPYGHAEDGLEERGRELRRRHVGRRPGNGNALQRRGAHLHADRCGGDLRELRDRLGHRPDQREAGRDAGLRERRLLRGQGGVHGGRPRGRYQRLHQRDRHRGCDVRGSDAYPHIFQRADEPCA